MSNPVLPDPLNVNITSPNPLLTTVENQGTNYVDQKILNGDYYSGFIQRQSTVPETVYRVVKTGNAPLFIESVTVDIDYSGISSGEFTLAVRVYVDTSNANTWSYTGGTAVSVGKPLNVELINQTAQSEWITSPVVTGPTGDADFVLLYNQYFRDSSGNRDSVSGVGSTFFKEGRKLVIPANSEMLIEIESSGANGNSAELLTYINFIEPGEY
tara:strand:+ start:21593 stop:22231 length:639 start_codon:yes stop_codon:yes gene_type:complete